MKARKPVPRLLAYLKSLNREAKQALAAELETSVEYLFQIARGYRRTSAEFAVAIDRETGGAVPCEDLLPDMDWAHLREQAADRAVA